LNVSQPVIQRARALAAAGRAAEAEVLIRQQLKRSASDPLLHAELARILAALGRRDQALFSAKFAASSKAIDAIEAGVGVLTLLGEDSLAVEALSRCVAVNPSSAFAHNALGMKLLELRRLDEARAAFERAFELNPADPPIAANIALIYGETWSLEEGLAILRASRDRHPLSAMLQHQMPYLSNYSDRVTREELFEEHRRLGALLGKSLSAIDDPPLHRPGPADADRPLKVGFLSGDFREHSVARFLEAILEHHDRDCFSFTLYPVVPAEDDTTRRFKGMCESWSTAALLSDREAVGSIRRDRIDILIDLAGLTKGARPGIIMPRAAPLQINYLGYPNTSAFPNMDVRLVDSISDPPGSESLATERLVRLEPLFLCFTPPPIARDIPARGPATNRPITFASFNYQTKVTPTTLDLWAAVLKQVPDSRLLLKATALSHAGVRDRVMRAFSSRGIENPRIELSPYLDDLAEHYRLYHRVDIALDPFPYHGTTTTCEALYMGVPVITLAGDRHASRVGVSLLTNTGIPEFIAGAPEEYIAKTVELARSRDRRSEYHANLRAKLAASPLGDAVSFARCFESSLRSIWRAVACSK
jgi:predicted O-linked N-acetylglucosamine transferase (SPINDLY family)